MTSKTQDQLYRERSLLAIALASTFRSSAGPDRAGWYYDEDNRHGWPVVWSELPTHEGYVQAGVHVRPELCALLDQSVIPRASPPGGYDGHSRVDRLNRYVNYIESDKLRHHNP